MSNEPVPFKSWAIVEVMGHQRYAGYLQEQAIGGTSFVRVDVPEVPASNGYDAGLPAFTKLLGQGAIFCITPCTEQTARRAAKSFRTMPAVCLYESPTRIAQRSLSYADDDSEE